MNKVFYYLIIIIVVVVVVVIVLHYDEQSQPFTTCLLHTGGQAYSLFYDLKNCLSLLLSCTALCKN